MSLKKVHDVQPKDFKFSEENLKKAVDILKRYPEKNKKSAVMPLLYLAQKQNENWIPLAAMKYIGNLLSMPYISVYEIATFYTISHFLYSTKITIITITIFSNRNFEGKIFVAFIWLRFS